MSNLGVFHWIRESVRRSVLLGFSDAVEQIGGVAGENESIHPQLAAVLREAAPAVLEHREDAPSSTKSPRKRLGRSLEQLRHPNAKPGAGA
jgi:hypothetical protein